MGYRAESRSWYLDPLVAAQKRAEFRRLIYRWGKDLQARSLLKTDLFEEANGEDQLLFDSFSGVGSVVGVDIDEEVVRRARRRSPRPGPLMLVSDVRDLPFPDGSLDFIISTSTLDHFESRDEIDRSLRELSRVLSSGGRVVVAMDNPWNPLYPVLRWVTRARISPVRLGKTLSSSELRSSLTECQLVVSGEEAVIHNPRLLSTLLFLLLRRPLGPFADKPIALLLWVFGLLRHLPTRCFTGCFVVVCAEKPAG